MEGDYFEDTMSDEEYAKHMKQWHNKPESPTEQEPVSNPMIEGEVKYTENYMRGFFYFMEKLTNIDWSRYFKEYRQNGSSQPIVKGEGKWSDEDMCAFAEWLAENDNHNGRLSFTVKQLFDEFVKTRKPTPSPEKQEEGYVNRLSEIVGTMKDIPEYTDKSDGIEQGEKEEWNKWSKDSQSAPYREELKQKLSQPKAPDITEGIKKFNELQKGITDIGNKDYRQPQALPAITEGDKMQKLHKLIASQVQSNWRENSHQALQILHDIRFPESHQTTPPTDSKDITMGEVYWGKEAMERISQLQSELQTLRDNNSKLVDLVKEYMQPGCFLTNGEYEDWYRRLSEALQSITQQDNKQKEI